MIAFNVPPYVPASAGYMREACEQNHKICGDGPFTAKAGRWLEQASGARRALLTTSCSHALDMMAMLADIREGDEVILPSYNFVSGGNAVALRGGRCVFVDIRPDTMNIDEKKIEAAVTGRTRALLVVHYAGVACEMDTVMDMARRRGLLVFEDAAQGALCSYKGRALGGIGDFGAYSFHETKNYSMGEGGALLLRDECFIERAEILREKGTDRSKFWRGQVDKYSWQDAGSSYLPSELNAAYLWGQLEIADEINARRLAVWERYHGAFRVLAERGRAELPHIPEGCAHNGHMYYIKCRDLKDRDGFIRHMGERGILCVFHYVPLHTSPAGRRFGRFSGEDEYTTRESERLVRLPLYYGIGGGDVARVIESAYEYFGV
jgi:dTDP-4-amino-4,6-dideoxygalactose transaminase